MSLSKFLAIISISGLTNISYAQLECPNNQCAASYDLISKELVTGPFGCDPKSPETLCREEIYVRMHGKIPGLTYTIYCKPLPSRSCPEVQDCWSKKLVKTEDNTILEAVNILKKNNFTAKNISSLKKLSKGDAKKVAVAINKLDISLLKDLSAKDVAMIEEFKSLPIDQQTDRLIKPTKYEVLAAAGMVAATWAAKQAANAYRDSLFGGDRLKSKEIKVDDKQFDLKD